VRPRWRTTPPPSRCRARTDHEASSSTGARPVWRRLPAPSREHHLTRNSGHREARHQCYCWLRDQFGRGIGSGGGVVRHRGRTIAGWSSSVDNNRAIIVVDNSANGAVYKGLAIGFTTSGAFLYATISMRHDRCLRFEVPTGQEGGNVHRPQSPAGYAPFGIASIMPAIRLLRTAGQGQERRCRRNGRGFIDIFRDRRNIRPTLHKQGTLNSPWGMAWAPFQGFGGFSNGCSSGISEMA